MKKVTGLGGFFFKAKNPKALGQWYKDHLDIPIDESFGGYIFNWRDHDNPNQEGYTVWSPFEEKTDYFEPGTKDFMVNFRVADLVSLLKELDEKGIKQIGETQKYPYGKFAWIMDPEGNKIELWEPLGINTKSK